MVGPPSIWTYCSSALGCRALVLPAIYRRNARTRRSRCWRRGTRLGVLGTCSDVPASAPTRTCSPWAAPSARGPGRRRSPTARRSWATFATQRGSMASSARSAFATVLPGRVVDGAGAVDGRGGTDRHWRATALNLRLPDVVYRLLPVRRGVRREVPGHGALPGPHRAPAALAGGPRLRRQAGRRHRQRGDGGDAGARDGPARGARDDAAAIAKLCAVAAGPGPGCRLAAPGAAGEGRVLAHPLEERPARHAHLPDQPSAATADEGADPQGVEEGLPEGYDIDTHFSPRYNPWDQRLCLVPGVVARAEVGVDVIALRQPFFNPLRISAFIRCGCRRLIWKMSMASRTFFQRMSQYATFAGSTRRSRSATGSRAGSDST